MSTALNELITRTFTVPQSTTTGPATDGASASICVSDMTGCHVQVASTGTISAGTILVQYSADNSNWVTSDTFQDGSSILVGNEPITPDFPYVRVKCTENIAGGGTVAASVMGRRAWRTG